MSGHEGEGRGLSNHLRCGEFPIHVLVQRRGLQSVERDQYALRSANVLENDGSRAVVGSGGVGVVLTIAFKLSMLSTPSAIDTRKYHCSLVL